MIVKFKLKLGDDWTKSKKKNCLEFHQKVFQNSESKKISMSHFSSVSSKSFQNQKILFSHFGFHQIITIYAKLPS